MLRRESHLALLGLLVTACGISEGINNFANNLKKDEYHGFSAPDLVSRGNYEQLRLYDWRAGGRYFIVALHRNAATTTVAIRALDGSVTCDVPGTNFSLDWPSADDAGNCIEQSGEIVVLDDADADGIGSLTFYDQNCAQLGDSIAEASLPAATYDHDRFFVRSGTRLLAVEPRGAGIVVLAEQLEQLGSYKSKLMSNGTSLVAPTWFIDGGQFAALDESGKVTMRYGSQATEVVSVDASDYLIDDGGRLLLATQAAATTYATDICRLRDMLDKGYVEYRSPCSDGPLRVAAINGPNLQTVAIDLNADHVFAFDLDFVNPAAMFTRPSSDGTPGNEIWFRNKNGDSQQLINGVAWVDESIGGQGYPDIGTRLDGTLRGKVAAIVDADGVSGRLVETNPTWNMNQVDGGVVNANERVLTQAQGVPIPWTRDPYYYQLAHFDGNVGVFIDPFPSGPAIAHGVPADPNAYITSNDTYMALLADYQSGTGRLGVMPANPTSLTGLTLDAGVFVSSNATRTISWLASDVALGSFEYYDQMNAIGYIDQWDGDRGAGRFVVHDFGLDADYNLADSVREQFAVSWPWVGVVYAVADGDQQGIWAQKAH